MNYLFALILGLVEGVTEFLPVSSTAHLLISARILGLPQTEYWKFFEVFVQSGAICAVLVAFIKELKNTKTILNVALSFVPTAIVGLLLHKIIKDVFFENLHIVVSALAGFALVFLIVERRVSEKKLLLKKDIKNLTWREAITFGLWQSLAVVPGVSRAGAVLVGGMLMGYKRSQVAMYSFLLAVPTIFAATALDVVKTDPRIVFENAGVSALGFFIAFVSAFMVVKWLIAYLQKNDLRPFAYYRIALAVGVFLMLVW